MENAINIHISVSQSRTYIKTWYAVSTLANTSNASTKVTTFWEKLWNNVILVQCPFKWDIKNNNNNNNTNKK